MARLTRDFVFAAIPGCAICGSFGADHRAACRLIPGKIHKVCKFCFENSVSEERSPVKIRFLCESADCGCARAVMEELEL